MSLFIYDLKPNIVDEGITLDPRSPTQTQVNLQSLKRLVWEFQFCGIFAPILWRSPIWDLPKRLYRFCCAHKSSLNTT